MNTSNRKKTLRLLAVLFFLCIAVTFVAILKWPSITRRVADHFSTATPECTYENFVFFDMPDVAAKWKSYFENVGIEPVDVAASGVYEKRTCDVPTSGRLPSPNHVGIDVTIRVPDATDDAALGALVLQMFSDTESLPLVPVVTNSVHLKFLAPNGTKEIDLDPNAVIDLNAQGLTPAQFFATLDGRYSPPETPTP